MKGIKVLSSLVGNRQKALGPRVQLIFFFLYIVMTSERINAQDSIRTEVFTLSTCDPNNFSLMKDLGKNSSKREFLRKLETKSNRLSVFKITGVNPLRYKYYINNEAVTQFMEASPLTLSINSFINGDYLITAPEIKVPEIFKTDSISSNAKSKIREFKNKIKLIDNLSDSAYAMLTNVWAELLAKWPNDSDTTKRTYLYNKDTRITQANTSLNKYRIERDKNLKEYQMYTNGLPLNNPQFALLEQYRKIQIDTSGSANNSIDSIETFQKQFAIQYSQHDKRLKFIESQMAEYENKANTGNLYKAIKDTLSYYDFIWSPNNYYNVNYVNDNINDVREQILNKRFQLYEEFVLNLATQIGVLVQNQFREYSSFNNALENFNAIDAIMLDSIIKKKDNLSRTFGFIQQTSAELQILVSYLDINTELYHSIVQKINSNYVFLLAYLKNLDYVIKENTIQYTLPTHGNLKNIDLIRYTVKREDKITKNTQTYNYDFWLRGGLKIDFSVGFFATRLTDNVYNKVLLDTAGGIDKIRITRQDDGRANFAFGGMVSITPRNGAAWINVGGSIGVAYSANQKLQVLAGLSAHFGKTERIIIHAGAAFGTIKYLDISANDFKFYDRDLKPIQREKLNEVKEKDRVYMLQSPDIKYSSYIIPTVDKFVVRPFFGISYNLSKKNALEAVSGAGLTTYTSNLK